MYLLITRHIQSPYPAVTHRAVSIVSAPSLDLEVQARENLAATPSPSGASTADGRDDMEECYFQYFESPTVEAALVLDLVQFRWVDSQQ
mmetsp:Transcript_19923/g.29527  ORF Transcript_19923/g.29527 Transcript_19923/m.29527 type:complete len:89 (+) Transcript_19923:2444-2710(+)